jgi:hypothetical protein
MSALRAALACVILLSASAVGAKPFVVQKPRTKTGAASLVVAPRASDVSVLVVRFGVGAFEDGIRSGVTRLAMRAMIDCNKREPPGAFRRDLYAAAAELSVETGLRESSFVLRAPRASFNDLADRLLALTLDPEIDKRSLAHCRRLVLRDAVTPAGRRDHFTRMAGEIFLAPRGSPPGADFRNRPYGDAAIVRKLKAKVVERHIGRWLTPGNATVLAVGGVDVGRLKATIAKHRGGKRSALRPLAPSAGLPKGLEHWAPREVAFHAQLIELETAEHVAAARVLGAILEERLTRRLGGAAAAHARVYPITRGWTSAVVVELPGGDGVSETMGAIDELVAGRFAENELPRNIDFVKRAMAREDAQPLALARSLRRGVAGGADWHSRAVAEALDGLNQARFSEIVKPWLARERAVTSRFGPENERAEDQP